jgi:hypothetical protein
VAIQFDQARSRHTVDRAVLPLTLPASRTRPIARHRRANQSPASSRQMPYA